MSDTPRTDAACDFTAPEKMFAESCKLERELAAAQALLNGALTSLDAITAQRDDYAERWHEIAVKQPDIDAVIARLRKTEAERDALAQTSGELLASIMGEWHDVRSAPPGPDYHDGWNAALLCVAEILKASNAGTEARVPPSPPVTVGRANQTTKGE